MPNHPESTQETIAVCVLARPLLAELICDALHGQPGAWVTAAVELNPSAAAQVRAIKPHVAVLDNPEGADLSPIIRAISEESPATKIVVIAAPAPVTTNQAKDNGRVIEAQDDSIEALASAVRAAYRLGAACDASDSPVDSPRPPSHPSAGAPPTPSRTLSPRERELLKLLASGVTIHDAARRLDVSSNTARTHLQNAMIKLGAHSRLGAVLNALQQRLISMDDL